MSTFLSMAPLHAVFSGRHGQPGPRVMNNPQELHRAVMHMFGHVGGDSPRASSGIIFRIDPASPGKPAVLLIRSAQKPVAPIDELAFREEGESPRDGTPVAFRLAVNAVRRKKDGGVSPVPRDDEPVEGFDSMTDWVANKLTGALTDVELINHDRNVLGARTNMAVQADHVDGFGIVEDAERLAALLASGVGRAKNYGCGLLTVKAIP